MLTKEAGEIDWNSLPSKFGGRCVPTSLGPVVSPDGMESN